MRKDAQFLDAILSSITEHLAVIDENGQILYTNQAWNQFGADNQYPGKEGWMGINYLDVCDKAAAIGDRFGLQAADGIRKVIRGAPKFYFEYPCHSPTEKRWFMMRVTPLSCDDGEFYVVAHQNITERKLAEEQVHRMANQDGLTGIANRRHFDQFFDAEWRRCARLQKPLSLALIDIDHFKLLNDTYGHLAGDDCLKRVSQTIANMLHRPSDLCARFGGEEFILVLGNMTKQDALPLLEEIVTAIRYLGIANEQAPTAPTVTVSIGLTSQYPTKADDPMALIRAADELMYRAKASGRNQIAS